MPFHSEEVIRLFPPNDLPGVKDGDWIDISTTYTANMRRQARLRAIRGRFEEDDVDYFEFTQALLELIIRGWSDPEPVSPDAIGELHPTVHDWLRRAFFEAANRPEEEKKELNNGSSPGSVPVPVTSRKNSPT